MELSLQNTCTFFCLFVCVKNRFARCLEAILILALVNALIPTLNGFPNSRDRIFRTNILFCFMKECLRVLTGLKTDLRESLLVFTEEAFGFPCFVFL